MFASGSSGESVSRRRTGHNPVRSSRCKGWAEVHAVVRRVRKSRRAQVGMAARGGRLVVMVDVASDGGERWREVSVGVSGEVEVKVFAWLDV
jgi:hypothetical protein